MRYGLEIVICTFSVASGPFLLAQGPKIQAWTSTQTKALWFINTKNTTSRVVVIDGGTFSDCVEVTKCDASCFSPRVILKLGDSACVGDATRAICTNPTDGDGNEIHQCEKRPPTTFKFQVFAKWAPGQSSSTLGNPARTAWKVMEAGFAQAPASPQTQAVPDRASIEEWISSQITSQNMDSIPIRYSYNRDQGDYSEDVTAVGFIRVNRFSLSNCQMEIGIDWRVDWTKVTTTERLGRMKNPERAQNGTPYSVKVDLKNVQPTTVSERRLDFTGAESWEKDLRVCKSPATDCKTESVSATSKGQDVELQSSTNSVRVRELQIPLSTATDAPRIVRALHDEVIACGGKDVNKALY